MMKSGMSTASSKRLVCPPASVLEGSDEGTQTFWATYKSISIKQKLSKQTLLEKQLNNDDLDKLIEETQCDVKLVVDAYQKTGVTTNSRTAVDRAESDAKTLINLAREQRQIESELFSKNVERAESLKANSIHSQGHFTTKVPKSTGHSASIISKKSSSHPGSYTNRSRDKSSSASSYASSHANRSSVASNRTRASTRQRKLLEEQVKHEAEMQREELEDLRRIQEAEELARKQVELAKRKRAAEEAEAAREEAEAAREEAKAAREAEAARAREEAEAAREEAKAAREEAKAARAREEAEAAREI